MSPATRVRVLTGALAAAWVAVIGIGARFLLNYENTPGRDAAALVDWPAGASFSRAAGLFTLVLFAHPDCPCTRATLTELETLTRRAQNRIAIHVVFRKPEAGVQEIKASGLWKTASRISGVSPTIDNDGGEVRRFRARTSGQVLLYNPQGKLVFSGGITDARGHVGDNPGADAVALLLTGQTAQGHAPVFGCSLLNPESIELNQESRWKKN